MILAIVSAIENKRRSSTLQATKRAIRGTGARRNRRRDNNETTNSCKKSSQNPAKFKFGKKCRFPTSGKLKHD